MTKRWIISGRIRADINFKEVIEAHTEKAAVQKAQARVYAQHGLGSGDVYDDEIFCEKIKDWGMSE